MNDTRKLAVSGPFGMAALYERNLTWLKFPADIHGPALKIAFETTFPAKLKPESRRLLIPPAGYPEEMDRHYVGKEDELMDQFYNPACQGNGDQRNIVFLHRFSPIDDQFPRKRLVFRRRPPRHFGRRDLTLPMAVARFGEEKPFGFSCWRDGDPGDRNYVNLAFPGLSGRFEPAFVRIDESIETVFYRIEAQEKGVKLHVFVKKVGENEAPPHLCDIIPVEGLIR